MTENWNERFARAEAERQRLREQQKAERARGKAERRREQEKTASSHDEVRTGGTISEFPLPADVFARRGGKASRQEATVTCEVCGETPQVIQFANGFIADPCACQRTTAANERAERTRREAQSTRLAQWKVEQHITRAQCARCYTWLGGEAYGMPLMTFDTFRFDAHPEAVEIAAVFAADRAGNLVLWSEGCGTGKTHLAAAICNFLMAQDVPCRFTTAQGLFDAFSARLDDHKGYQDLVAEAGSTPLLVIDDLDAMHLTAYKQAVFFEVFNQRYLRRLPTVMTTNARVEMLPDTVTGLSDYLGRKVVSRLCDTAIGGLTVVEMNGEDYRRRDRGM